MREGAPARTRQEPVRKDMAGVTRQLPIQVSQLRRERGTRPRSLPLASFRCRAEGASCRESAGRAVRKTKQRFELRSARMHQTIADVIVCDCVCLCARVLLCGGAGALSGRAALARACCAWTASSARRPIGARLLLARDGGGHPPTCHARGMPLLAPAAGDVGDAGLARALTCAPHAPDPWRLTAAPRASACGRRHV